MHEQKISFEDFRYVKAVSICKMCLLHIYYALVIPLTVANVDGCGRLEVGLKMKVQIIIWNELYPVHAVHGGTKLDEGLKCGITCLIS